jgi:SAM-dependent methyltransferase
MKIYRKLLRNQKYRSYYALVRAIFKIKILRSKVRTYEGFIPHVAENTIFSNKRRIVKNNKKHPHPRAKYLLGIDMDQSCSKSDLLIENYIKYKKSKRNLNEIDVLSIGPRTEGEIFNIYSHGFTLNKIKAIDLISYSKLIDIGDMHDLPYEDNKFDLVILGWCIAYSDNKKIAIEEAIRVTRHGGTIAIGVSYSPKNNDEIIKNRGYLIGSKERLRSLKDILNLFTPTAIDQLEFGIDIAENHKHLPGQIVGLFRVKK